MAWSPIDTAFLQYQADASGNSASGYFIKAYAAGTSTPISISYDEDGSSLTAKVELDSLGYVQNGSGGSTLVYIDQKFRLVLYLNATDADNNTFANAVQDIDDIPQVSILQDNTQVFTFSTVADMKAENLVVDTLVVTKGYNSINDGGEAKYIIQAAQTVDEKGDHTLTNGNVALLQKENDITNVVQYGAVADWNGTTGTDNTASIQAAFNSVLTGGTVLFPDGQYFITDTICPQYSGETPLQRYNLYLAGSPVAGPIEDITVIGYGARLHAETATFLAAFPNCMIGFIDTARCEIRGLQFESDLNDRVADWLDPTNYFNLSEPTPKGAPAIKYYRFTDGKIKDVDIYHCNTGVVMADDTQNAPSITDTMETYRGEISGCYIYNTWQALSISIGSMEELLIHHNNLEYTFVKLVQETDQGRAIKFTNNTGRDVSGILINTNDSEISHNTFNNLLGGIRLQPQGGGNPDVTYDYDLLNLSVESNKMYSDHSTTVTSGTAQPTQFLQIVANDTLTAGQTVVIDNLNVENNTIELWPSSASTTAGAFIDTGGDANRVLKNASFIRNKVRMNNADGRIISLPSESNASTFQYEGEINFSQNVFERSSAAGNIEIVLHSDTLNSTSVLTFEENFIDTEGTNRQVSTRNFGRVSINDNDLKIGRQASTTTSVFYIQNTPLADIRNNNARRNNTDGRGYFFILDGDTAGVYSTALDEAVWRVTDNRIDDSLYVFRTDFTFPASAQGFYDLSGNILEEQTGYNVLYPGITGFLTENVVTPQDSSTAPPSVPRLTPPGHVVMSLVETSSQPTGWKWGTANWIQLGTNP